MPAATILFVAQPIKQGVRGIEFWNFLHIQVFAS